MVPGSSPGWPITKKSTPMGALFCCQSGLEQHGTAEGGANNSPVGCCLVRGSQRIGMSNGVGCRSEGRQDLNSNDDDRGLRPKTSPGRGKMSHSDKRGNAGRSCWGSVLIFQGPAKGLQKNQQTQPVRPCAAGQAISPAGGCLARGSQRVGMSKSVGCSS